MNLYDLKWRDCILRLIIDDFFLTVSFRVFTAAFRDFYFMCRSIV